MELFVMQLSFVDVSLQVTMADKEGAERACENPNPVIEGRRANVNLAYIGAKPKHGQPGSYNCTAVLRKGFRAS